MVLMMYNSGFRIVFYHCPTNAKQTNEQSAAFEEALFIRQKNLGPGAKEVAETTNSIWMLLHQQNCEMKDSTKEENEEQ